MRILLCSLLFAAALLGQTIRMRFVEEPGLANLRATLVAIGNRAAPRAELSKRLADNLSALADPNRQPSQTAVTDFADQLTDAIGGNKIALFNVTQIQHSLVEALRGSAPNFSSAGNLRSWLSRSGVDPAKIPVITRSLLAIGEEIRGPDDMRLDQKIARPRN